MANNKASKVYNIIVYLNVMLYIIVFILKVNILNVIDRL